MIIPLLLASQNVGVCNPTPTTLALLDTVAFAEGTHQSYTTHFTGVTAPIPPSGHPDKTYCHKTLCSTAYGRYQFLSSTWEMIERNLGFKDMRPGNQDRAAIWLMRRRDGRVCSQIDDSLEFQLVLSNLGEEWASLPGSPYGQPTKSLAELWTFYQNRLLNIYIYNTNF